MHKLRCIQSASEYVGMTARTLGTWVDEHLRVSYLTGAHLTLECVNMTICGSPFDINNF